MEREDVLAPPKAEQPLPWFPFYPDDFWQDENVQAMNGDEIAGYMRLLSICWKKGSIPDNITAIAGICRMDATGMAKAWSRLSPCFTESDEPGRLINPRMTLERDAAYERAGRQLVKSKAGAAARWKNHATGNATGNATGMPQGMPNDASLQLQLQIEEQEEQREREAAKPPARQRAPAPSRFFPPTFDQIMEHVMHVQYAERGWPPEVLMAEALKFLDHFNSNGWKVGGKTKMVSWRAAYDGWMRRWEDFDPVQKALRIDRAKLQKRAALGGRLTQ